LEGCARFSSSVASVGLHVDEEVRGCGDEEVRGCGDEELKRLLTVEEVRNMLLTKSLSW